MIFFICLRHPSFNPQQAWRSNRFSSLSLNFLYTTFILQNNKHLYKNKPNRKDPFLPICKHSRPVNFYWHMPSRRSLYFSRAILNIILLFILYSKPYRHKIKLLVFKFVLKTKIREIFSKNYNPC